MKNNTCIKCNFLNDPNAIYCQQCGNKVAKKSLKKFASNLQFGSLAGMGSKGVSVAPIVGVEMDKAHNNKFHANKVKVLKHFVLDDGSWFCPYCGNKNKRTDKLCVECSSECP